MGVVYLTPRCLLPCWWPNVISGSCSAACSVPRRLVLRGNLSAVWDSVEGRRLWRLQPVMAWPAADRGGLFSAAEPIGAVQRQKTAWVTFSVFWLAGGVFVRGGKKRDDFEPRRWSGGLVQVPGAGHFFLLPRRQFLRRVRCVVPCGGLEVPAHGRGVLSGGSGPRARERGVQRRKWRGPRALSCSGLGVFLVVGRLSWVQQHCGVGSCTAVASWCDGVCPFCSSINAGTLQWFDNHMIVMMGGNCG